MLPTSAYWANRDWADSAVLAVSKAARDPTTSPLPASTLAGASAPLHFIHTDFIDLAMHLLLASNLWVVVGLLCLLSYQCLWFSGTIHRTTQQDELCSRLQKPSKTGLDWLDFAAPSSKLLGGQALFTCETRRCQKFDGTGVSSVAMATQRRLFDSVDTPISSSFQPSHHHTCSNIESN